jgi:ABC-type multidrug transport system fused ATPase/permease subunit
LSGDRVLGKGLRVLGRSIREQPRLFTIGVAGSVLFSVLIIVGAYVVGGVVGGVVVPALDHRRVGAAAVAGGAAVIFTVSAAKVVGLFGRRLGAGAMQYRLQATYRRRVTRRYLELPLAWHHRHATGTLLSNANADIEAAFYPIAPLPFAVGTIVMLGVAVASLFLTDWVLALVGTGVFLALIGLNVVYSRRMSPRVSAAQRLRAEVSAVAHESFDGALVVKTMGREAAETERFAAKAGELRDAMIRVGRVRGLFDPALDALPSFGTLTVLLVGAWRLRQGAITVADLVSVAFLFTVLAFPVRAIGWVLAELPRSAVGWERVQNVLSATGDMAYGDAELPAGSKPAALSFEHVDFGYENGPPVLRDVTFEVPAGRTVALVGPTGSGKSTIASLAARLVDPASGAVYLDDADVSTLTHESLAATVALVPQIPFVFDDTVRGNITLDRAGVDDSGGWAALRVAQAEAFVSALPQGLDTMVGERGTTLSGGQRQRLTLARALAGGPRLLILDDATSAVDPRVEAAILASLRDGSSRPDGTVGASILIVAYRRATIALADEVVYLEHGRVVAHGTHAELLDTVSGYANLVTAYERADAEREREKAYGDQEVSA